MRHAMMFAIALAFAAACGVATGAHLQLRYAGPGYYAYPTDHASEMAIASTDAARQPTIAPRRVETARRGDRRHDADYALALASVPLLVANAVVPSTPLLFTQLVAFFS